MRGNPECRSSLAQEITDRYAVYTIAEPKPGLVMSTMRETAQRSRFFLGEVLVTECKVQIEKRIGLGIIAGEDERAAFELAVIDAAWNANLPETSEWEGRLAAEDQAVQSRDAMERARVMETRVDFQTMDVD